MFCRVKANKKSKIYWKQKICRNPGSNQGPYDLQSYALPTELLRRAGILCTLHALKLLHQSNHLQK